MDSDLQNHTLAASAPRHRLMLQLSVEGDLRFISHRDTIRMLERALVRADLPMAYSQGFNPRLRLSLPVPRSVGMASEDDGVVVELTQPCPPQEVSDKLNEQLPAGAEILAAHHVAEGQKPRPRSVSYQVPLGAQQTDAVRARIDGFTCSSSAAPGMPDNASADDNAPSVQALQLEGHLLSFKTIFVGGHTPTPRQVLESLGLVWNQTRHRICRKRIEWI